MASFPVSPRAAFMDWCGLHAPVFTAHAAAIGLSPAQASAFNTLTTAAQSRIMAQAVALQAYRVATAEADEAVGALRGGAGDTVRMIRAFAEMQAKPSTVYNLAQIPEPANPSPLPPPGQPSDLSVTLTPGSGALTLRWKCVNPANASGTSYLVRRKLPGAAAFSFLGTAGRKMFVDTTLPAGPDSVQYTVQGLRSDILGPVSNLFIIHFGSGGGGGLTVESVANPDWAATGSSGSTVNGKAVSKTLPQGGEAAYRR